MVKWSLVKATAGAKWSRYFLLANDTLVVDAVQARLCFNIMRWDSSLP